MQNNKIALIILLTLSLCACHKTQPGPDQTVTGGILGAGWGAGAGAIIGEQLSYSGEGALIGAGFGLAGGAMAGLGYDAIEEVQIEHQEQLAALRTQNLTNAQDIQNLQAQLDQAATSNLAGVVYQVFFDEDATNLRAGSVANLEVIADAIKTSTHGTRLHVIGHSDDSGTPEYSQRISESRARAVSAYLAERGISNDQIEVKSYGSTRPIATNSSPIGRQLNRRVDIYLAR